MALDFVFLPESIMMIVPTRCSMLTNPSAHIKGIDLDFILTGKLTENGSNESLNGKLRD